MRLDSNLDEFVNAIESFWVGVGDENEILSSHRLDIIGRDCVDGTRRHACVAVDTRVRIDNKDPVRFMDAIHGTGDDTRLILHVDARFADDEGHFKSVLGAEAERA